MTEVRLPWPKRILWPNGRGHHMTIYKARKAAKAVAFWTAQEAKLVAPESELIAVIIEFHPPTRAHSDEDGRIGACKAYLDGIAKAVGVNDSRFRLRPSLHPPLPLGAVIIKLEAIP